ncbi:hypothetical protein LTR56_004696 [Elasticomyces elasticus]|nr:hypothetical protein LTR56_004696 [Elasticomyces elasticus]KAK3665551.1 hypothetical protein LTR22_003491 [Elasticomyces elasticus]KAK5768862.1 hypothetical protein LTS12_000922 [Elasticomyces elasticus]
MEHSPLARLPGEMRNRIYRLVLISNSNIRINHTGPSHPPLLLTCRAIRAESFVIYWKENQFVVPIPNYDSDLCIRWHTWRCYLESTYRLSVDSRGVDCCPDDLDAALNGDSWNNLIEWLERYHNQATGRSIPSKPRKVTGGRRKKDPRPADQLIVGCMFATSAQEDRSSVESSGGGNSVKAR